LGAVVNGTSTRHREYDYLTYLTEPKSE
jgi:hypothetical protein